LFKSAAVETFRGFWKYLLAAGGTGRRRRGHLRLAFLGNKC
jgi:hypothetical protein